MMNKFFLIAAVTITIGVVGCKGMAQNTEKKTVQNDAISVETTTQSVAQPQQPDMLVGEIDRQQLETGKFAKWFESGYDAYEVKGDTDMISNLLKGVDITIFMGTWCPDSRREVPNFYKIMDAVVGSPDIKLIAVTRAKTTPEGLESGKDILRVPTFIFTKNGKELGRIVEYPIETLEKDMIKILKGEDYKHAYAE